MGEASPEGRGRGGPQAQLLLGADNPREPGAACAKTLLRPLNHATRHHQASAWSLLRCKVFSFVFKGTKSNYQLNLRAAQAFLM